MSEPMHVVCPHCDAVNRLDAPRLRDDPRCGKCHQALFGTGPVELTESRLQRHLERSDLPVVVDFWAPWCGPCQMMAPQYVQAAKQLEPRVRLVKVNTEAQPTAGARYGIRSIPTLVLFRAQRELARQSGAVSAAAIASWVEQRL